MIPTYSIEAAREAGDQVWAFATTLEDEPQFEFGTVRKADVVEICYAAGAALGMPGVVDRLMRLNAAYFTLRDHLVRCGEGETDPRVESNETLYDYALNCIGYLTDDDTDDVAEAIRTISNF